MLRNRARRLDYKIIR
ncbi:hypothetical protein ODZ35_07475 [Escherichia coli]|nr:MULTISPECIES: hypothetical protein [Enterobacteriaceae]MCT9650904.1 hypothetical protein [Escherichia coli]MCV7806105.1 hypothetical protein [Escherichia coli]MCV8344568.1 hypothetical protein [Escherichia coli]MCV8483653.1 hypothetical protein [Escherichia coli]MCV8898955.1 hypothetical protein [Escherichia coli]